MVLDSAHDQAIERATIRARARHITARLIETERFDFDQFEYYAVESFSSSLSHRVAISYTAEGIDSVCDCQGFQHGKICQHLAAAWGAAGLLPDAPPNVQKLPADWLIRRLAGED